MSQNGEDMSVHGSEDGASYGLYGLDDNENNTGQNGENYGSNGQNYGENLDEHDSLNIQTNTVENTETNVQSRSNTSKEKFLVDSLNLRRKLLVNDISSKMKELQYIMITSSDYHPVMDSYKSWLNILEEYHIVHNKYQDVLTDSERDVYLTGENKDFELEINQFRRYTDEWLKLNKPNPIPPPDYMQSILQPNDSISQIGNVSHLPALLLKREEDVAVLQEKRRYLEKKQTFEIEKLQMKLREEKLNLESEVAIAEAKSKAVQKAMSEHGSVVSQVITNRVPPAHTENIPSDLIFNKDLIQSLRKPKVEIKKFGGDPSDFLKFMRQIESQVFVHCSSSEEKLNYLETYTYGQPHDVVCCYSNIGGEKGFDEALKDLRHRYGNSDRIASTYIRRALDFKKIKADNHALLDKFGIFLAECLYAVKTIDSMKTLNYTNNIQILVSKLPNYMHDRWRNRALEIQKREDICFKHFVDFVQNEARKLNDPIYGREAIANAEISISTSSSTSNHFKPKPVVGKTFSTNVQDSGTSDKPFLRCKFCNYNHFVGDCRKLAKLSKDEIAQFIAKEKLCFGCLKFGHQKAKCWNKLSCSICQLQHPTLLHNDSYAKPVANNGNRVDKFVENETTDSDVTSDTLSSNVSKVKSSACASMEAGDCDSNFCTMPIIPTKVVSGCKTIDTYAFLDVGSSVCFITKSLLSQLNIKGKSSKLLLETMNNTSSINASVVENVQVFSYNLKDSVTLPKCYSIDKIPVTSDHIPTTGDVIQYSHLSDINIPEVNCDIGLIIGSNVADAYTPFDIRVGPRGTPHATRTALGWILWNVIREGPTLYSNSTTVNRLDIKSVQEIEHLSILDRYVRHGLDFDFPDHVDRMENSILDNLFLNKVQSSIVKDDDMHYQINLPFKNDNIVLPKNYNMAKDRLESLKRKLSRNEKFYNDYVEFMNSILSKNYAELVPESEIGVDRDKLWFVVHHGVYHKRKQKLRIVFDCSAKCQGVSLNDVLLSGPDLANSLLGVLMRFRLGRIAIMSDLESMFHQVRVPTEDRCSLRFLWWPNGDLSLEPKQYQMTAHLFGAVSSPSCANFALQQIARDNVGEYPDEVINTLINDFYVDDCLHSLDNESDAVNLVKDLVQLCKTGGFHLHKWISNSEIVNSSIPAPERANCKNPVLGAEDPVIERALGITWDVSSDTITFKLNIADKPFTRRGILSVVSAVYDPLGLAAPALLPAKRLLQELCQTGLSWDEKIDNKDAIKWSKFLDELPLLENLNLSRCIKPEIFGTVIQTQLHHFTDASEVGYGVASYIRLVDDCGMISCALILGKSRVAPLKKVTIPRLELTAASIAVRLNKVIIDNLKCQIDSVHFWTDSTTVLNYIRNDEARYRTFVANRVSTIRENSNVTQWNYVNTKENPADEASRGLSVKDLVQSNRWFKGPAFLWKTEEHWPSISVLDQLPDLNEDPEVKRSVNLVQAVNILEDPVDKLINYFSSWTRLIRAVTLLRLVFRKLRNKVRNVVQEDIVITTEEIEKSKLFVIKHEQLKYLEDVVKICENKTEENNIKVLKSSGVKKLDPFVDSGVLRVGGRLSRADMCLDSKHQIILPKLSPVSVLIIRDAHSRVGHLGKNATLSYIRKNYWILGASNLIKSVISKCVRCRKYSAKRMHQKMSDLPVERVISGEAPFNRTGVDYFGPFEIKRARSIIKRYGVIFTCMNSRAVHLEVASSLDTDSCINAIRRFIARRGVPKYIRSDNGTNLVGAQRELKDCINNWNQHRLTKELSQKGIQWDFNPPAASHFGGVWERLIRSVRKVLCSIEKDQIGRLDDECLQTLFCEVEQILNNRPITKISEVPNDLDALSPSHLLNGFHNSSYSPTVTDKTDCYIKRRWRRIQYLCDIFWKRWSSDYLTTLQERQKWFYPTRNVCIDDIVLVIDCNIRNSWALGRVVDVVADKGGLSRIATVKTQSATLKRPITKLCLILECDD